MVIRNSARALVASLVLGFAPAAFCASAGAPATFNVSNLHSQGGYDGFIVTYRDGTRQRTNASAATQAVSAAMSRTSAASPQLRAGKSAAVQVTYGRKLGTGADLVRTSRKLSRDDAAALIRQIASDPAVAHVQADVIMRAGDDIRATAVTPVMPNDPNYAGYQWHLRAPDGTAEKIGSDTVAYANRGGANIANAWNLSDGSGVTVAVLDTGITVHPDLDTSLAASGYDFLTDAFYSGRATDGRIPGGWDPGDWTTGDDKYLAVNGGCVDANNPAEDSSWHGTHVSSTIAELTNNGVGMAGVAYNAKVLPVRVLGHCGGLSSDIADAIVWASGGHVDGVPDNTHHVDVINMSLGGEGKCSDDDVTADAIAGAISRGVTVVVSAGNSDDDAANYTPASCPGAITVGSNGITGKRAYYSNYGSTVALSAPGGGIYPNDASSGSSTPYAGFVWQARNSGTHEPAAPTYSGFAGTSQAAPHVSGTVALVLAAVKGANLPTPTPAQIRAYLVSTTKSFPATPDEPIGSGIVDAYAAINKALDNDTGNPGGPDDAVVLTNGVALSGQAGASGTTLGYKIDVPAGARNLAFRTYAGSGDVSIYVKNGAAATSTAYDYKSAKPSINSETVTVAHPAAGTWYVTVDAGAKAFANVIVQASFTKP